MEGSDPFARVTVPGAVLSFFSTQGMESMVPGSMAAAASGGFTLEFQVADVDARHERLLARGIEILKPPTTQPWGRRSVWLRDPDGNIVNLYQEA
ncbi:VOC family protein [Streptomyces sp. NPDC048288]|uniref:VOC family protein n=1 Tax=Streptomyces sp. NPDC048288 TaxID=3365529 RepID=UPI003721682A